MQFGAGMLLSCFVANPAQTRLIGGATAFSAAAGGWKIGPLRADPTAGSYRCR